MLDVVWCRRSGRWGKQLEAVVVEPGPATVHARIVAVGSDVVRACFDGSILTRAWAVASLKPAQRRKIFGSYGEHGSHYELGRVLRAIGLAIPPVETGGNPAVIAALQGLPMRHLQRAIRERSPAAQIDAATWSAVEEMTR